MIVSTYRFTLFILFNVFIFNFMNTYSAYANYKRCWIDNGVASINCTPADGNFFIKEKEVYKKCPAQSGNLKNNCKVEDGFGMFLTNHQWFECPIQNGKKIDKCTLATGYYTIFVPHLPFF